VNDVSPKPGKATPKPSGRSATWVGRHWSEVVTTLAFLAAVGSLYYTAYSAMQVADQFELQRRPWLRVDFDIMTYDSINKLIGLQVSLENIGQTAAAKASVIYQAMDTLKGSFYEGKPFDSIPWAQGDGYLVPGETWVTGPKWLKYPPGLGKNRGTEYYHICCFYMSVETRRKFYFERIVAVSDLEQVALSDPPRYVMNRMSKKAYLGRVRRGRIVLDWKD